MPRLTLTPTLTLLLAPLTTAQFTPVTQFFNTTTFPHAQPANVTHHLTTALSLASTSGPLYQFFLSLCIAQPVYPALFIPPSGFVEPFSPFSSLFFVGHSFVSSWAYDTGAGLVVIDALSSPDEVDAVLLPSLAHFGYAGEDVKHVVLTHEHFDHYGGARVLQERFGAALYASARAWEGMEGLGADAGLPAPPTRDRTLEDGQTLVVGDVAFEVVLTPGHTPGTLSLIFPVWEEGDEGGGSCADDGSGTVGGAKKGRGGRGTQHVAGLSGGTATPAGRAAREEKVRSQERFAAIARERGVDVLLSNHHVADGALWNADLLKYRAPGAPNPFVVGVDGFERYMRINAVSTRVIAAREGMGLDV
ncbi:Beta-lactamase [Lasiodiplodia theobromae]|uniref:Beta-lactamase n=1 Tax=Lasiodiplodia theobromae TaxID=45133 RepID=UPI0015C348DC|nr:Beta-lactamase [Lasiodiplodia theobromae]KAF4539119.1 Beta-lactamase [Lasiodiplodia theobromae]